ncbi:MAG: [FeFe] hydrogenase H-cluster radical SAM maturase HydE [Rikenellaceae bacterium]
MIQWINRLREERSLPDEGYRALLLSNDAAAMEYLRDQAREVAIATFGKGIYIRGLIEITNRCRNNCYYCGIRASNREVVRYSLSHDEILDCCREGYGLGFRTFVMQGGEDPALSDEWLVGILSSIRAEFEDVAITLSLGERSRESYSRLFRAGANRYLLRHESCNQEHYRKLHPASMSLENRLECLANLKQIGYQTGTGIMVGSPFQSVDHIMEDIKYIERLEPAMIGIGPFIPHSDTPFAGCLAGDVDRTIRLISIFRLIHPEALIPSTTALASLAEDGRERGILAGANVVMPNLSPAKNRASYSLYNNKASFGSESAEGLRLLSERLDRIGYYISYDRGDAPKKG